MYWLIDVVLEIWSKIPLFIRKIIALIVAIAALIYLPYGGQVIGRDIVEYNVNGRTPWRSEADARAGQDDWPTYLFWVGLIVAGLWALFTILYLFGEQFVLLWEKLKGWWQAS